MRILGRFFLLFVAGFDRDVPDGRMRPKRSIGRSTVQVQPATLERLAGVSRIWISDGVFPSL